MPVRKVTEDVVGIRSLYESPLDDQRTEGVATVDIVAIHGIGAHPDDTWCKKVDANTPDEGYVNWLSDRRMLPAVVPQARIMRYGYQSQWFGEETIRFKASTIAQRFLLSLQRARKECPLRPLIFIAHCFGGLVILKAIVDAKGSESKWPGIFHSTVGMLFFGTPFRGAAGLNQSEMIQAIQSHYEDDQILGSNLNILAPGNECLTDLMEAFFETRQGKHLAQVAWLFEQKPSNVGAICHGARNQKFVVDQTSGCLDQCESIKKFSLSRDHFSMNKFGRPKEEDFLMVCEVIKSMVEQGPRHTRDRDQECDEFRIPLDLTGMPVPSRFIYRDTEMTEMEDCLCPNHVTKERKIYVLHGLGGIGKTQLAVALARKHQDTFSAILWLNGNSTDTLTQSLAAFRRHIDIVRPPKSTPSANQHVQDDEADADAVLRWLSLEKNHGWLAIFDNVDREWPSRTRDHQAYDIMSFLPTADHGSVLITTRLATLGEIGVSKKVKRLSSGQALELLSDRSGLPASTQDIDKLANRLGWLPLALVQAGRYLRETGTSCTRYLILYEESWHDLGAEVHPFHDYANGSIQTTWTISYDHILEINPTAAQLLQLLAFLDHQDIWYELFSRGSQGCTEGHWLQKLAQSETAFNKAITTLLTYSLIEPYRDLLPLKRPPSSENYSMHPVVHDWCRQLVTKKKAELTKLAFIIVGFTIPSRSEPGCWLLRRRLVPYANRCLPLLVDGLPSSEYKDNAVSDSFNQFGILAIGQGKLQEAEEMFQQALKGYEKLNGPDHESALDTIHHLGAIYSNQGKWEKAEEMYRRAMNGYEKLYVLDNEFSFDIINNLGVLYYKQGKEEKAEEMYRRTLNGYEKSYGPDYKFTLDASHNLGILYGNQGKQEKAEENFQRALKGYEKLYGPDDPSTLRTAKNLRLLHQVDYQEVEEIDVQDFARNDQFHDFNQRF